MITCQPFNIVLQNQTLSKWKYLMTLFLKKTSEKHGPVEETATGFEPTTT